MSVEFIRIGFGNIVSANRIITICNPDSSPVKRLIQDARERGRLLDATCGRRTRSVIVTDSDHVILATVQPITVLNRQFADKRLRIKKIRALERAERHSQERKKEKKAKDKEGGKKDESQRHVADIDV